MYKKLIRELTPEQFKGSHNALVGNREVNALLSRYKFIWLTEVYVNSHTRVNTRRKYAYVLCVACMYFRNKDVRYITRDRWSEYLTHLSDTYSNNSTFKTHVIAINSFLRFCGAEFRLSLAGEVVDSPKSAKRGKFDL